MPEAIRRLLPVTPRDPRPLLLLAVLLYLMRPVSYLVVLRGVGAERMPFDLHGFRLLGDTAVLALLAVPLAWLLVRLRRRYRPGQPLLAPAATPARTALSYILAFAIALPPPAQWDALRFLRPSESWPVILAGTGWLVVVCVLRAAVVAPPGSRP